MAGKNTTYHTSESGQDINAQQVREILQEVYDALRENGYDAIDQMVGYLLSDDPSYITNYNDARTAIQQLNRYDIVSVVLRSFLTSSEDKPTKRINHNELYFDLNSAPFDDLED